MSDWYVYQSDGAALGPWSTDTVASSIVVGTLAPDVWVAAPGGPNWVRALDVPVITERVSGIPTRRRESGLRMVPAAVQALADDRPAFGSTMMIVEDAELTLIEDDPYALGAGAPATLYAARPPAPVPAPLRADDTARYPVRDFLMSEGPDAALAPDAIRRKNG